MLKRGFFLRYKICTNRNMKYPQILSLILIIIGLNSCFIADDIYGEPGKTKLSLKQKTQNIVSSYIKAKSEGLSYYKYGFSELIIYKPKELSELDDLKKSRKNKRVDQVDLEADIKLLEQEIREKDIKYSLELDHVYSLTNSELNEIKLYETRFFINDSLKVENVKQLLLLNIDWIEEVAFSHYFHETAIFQEGDYYQSKLLSKEFYTFFKYRQLQIEGVSEKSSFLKHTLWLCNEVKMHGAFEQEPILQKMTVNRFKENSEITDYEVLKFSDLYEINADENLKGYYFFHKFSHSNNGKNDTSAVYVGFTSYYEIKEILELKKPYKSYFDE